MHGRIWEGLLLVIALCIAAKLVTAIIQPLIPLLIGGAIAYFIGVALFKKQRRW